MMTCSLFAAASLLVPRAAFETASFAAVDSPNALYCVALYP